MLVPRGFAHGYLTLTADSEVLYFSDNKFSIEHERGIKWNDPELSIQWPDEPKVISTKDENWPDFHQGMK